MLAVHFGAGNIGRGFIGSLLYKAGYHTTFVDVNDQVIKELNEKQQYRVVLADENEDELTVSNVSGLNSTTSPEEVIQAIVKADIVTTAVGPTILPIISDLLTKGLRERLKKTGHPLNIIACENMIGGSSLLNEEVLKQVTEAEKEQFNRVYGFPNAAVDRIVPNQTNDDLLQVSVEPYYEWVVEETDVKGEKPDIQGITYVSDLTPYIERKLFTVNTGHAVAAYIGHSMGYKTIEEAMSHEPIQEITLGALSESGEVLIRKYGFDHNEHLNYINKIIHRFQNPYISDDVTRVGRGPIRKLGSNDRLIRPATLYLKLTGKDPVNLAKTIAAALTYQNKQDPEAVELQEMIEREGYQTVLEKVSGLEKNHPFIAIVQNQLDIN
ncbi:mannitol-1-phosphate 5-dehydrogenase [Aquibacillus sp. 3ASR75-11]|uniref:Mannitol-1-phosphate 5-dehydrogenase n=1 Tax=Terrihalobacillus insolitus TaxID=2950438 RepID=A0A9X4AKH4_9BACI|nr:mannitol-1-phosphate 5-dehydrogenase [Terrihalobacillus insolitus]MDC3412008.1 mannitol-1-phosphate 5-dehydrogenase [Terrihalobacillus insolitus]MDC3423307.1 mannitol-1-phosphate 5-dehydrogenase [Terrihalobacillus insolitus]